MVLQKLPVSDADGRAALLAQTLALEPLAHGFSRLRARQSSLLLALMGLVALILLLTAANRSEVLALIVKHTAALVVIGLACGLAAAPLAARPLQGLFFEVTTLDPLTFISVGTLMLVVGVLPRSFRRERGTDRFKRRG